MLYIALLLFSYSQMNAQNVYPISVDAYNLDQRKSTFLKTNKYKKKGSKIASDALMAVGFDFAPANDTLLLNFTYEDHIVGGVPCEIYANSSKSARALSIDSYKESTYKESSAAGNHETSYYAMMYSGDMESFKKFFAQTGGKTLGCYSSALRVVITDGKIIYPTILWDYECIINTKE